MSQTHIRFDGLGNNVFFIEKWNHIVAYENWIVHEQIFDQNKRSRKLVDAQASTYIYAWFFISLSLSFIISYCKIEHFRFVVCFIYWIDLHSRLFAHATQTFKSTNYDTKCVNRSFTPNIWINRPYWQIIPWILMTSYTIHVPRCFAILFTFYWNFVCRTVLVFFFIHCRFSLHLNCVYGVSLLSNSCMISFALFRLSIQMLDYHTKKRGFLIEFWTGFWYRHFIHTSLFAPLPQWLMCYFIHNISINVC